MAGSWCGIVLAAGKGTRMRSKLPKMLHPVAGVPMVQHVLAALDSVHVSRSTLVASHEVAEGFGKWDRLTTVIQDPPLGTGDAVRQALDSLEAASQLLVVNGDMPLVTTGTLERAVATHDESGAAITIVSCLRAHAAGLGRVQRSANGEVISIIEAPEATGAAQPLTETNEGIYCIDTAWARGALPQLPEHKNGEYYLTDLVALAVKNGRKVACLTIDDPDETSGVNDRVQLANAEAVMRRRICKTLMRCGVTIADPATTYIDANVSIGQDTTILPNTTISGDTTIGEDCRIGPNTTIRDSRIGNECVITDSTVEQATLEDRIDIGPYSHLRPESYVESHVHIGNYVEIKASRIGARTLIGHFSYIGDATLGTDVNVGAGTITCNYDGVDKHRTTIGNHVFLGSDTMLVAPVTVGDGAATGAGAVVTHDVPPGARVVGVPARPLPEKSP